MKLSVRLTVDDLGQFTAECPTLPGCISHGDSRHEACERLDEAIRGYMAAVNNFVPEHVEHEVVDA